jgi:hypothetical protein
MLNNKNNKLKSNLFQLKLMVICKNLLNQLIKQRYTINNTNNSKQINGLKIYMNQLFRVRFLINFLLLLTLQRQIYKNKICLIKN